MGSDPIQAWNTVAGEGRRVSGRRFSGEKVLFEGREATAGDMSALAG